MRYRRRSLRHIETAIAARQAAMKAMMMYSTISFAYELDVVGAGMDELEVSGESVGEVGCEDVFV